MGSILLKALYTLAVKAFATMATATMLEWMLFKAAETYVKSTKTTLDDEWLAKFKEGFKEAE